MSATGEAGKVVIDGDEATLVFHRRLSQRPEAVWKALTDPSELSGWYMTRATIDGRDGGMVDLHAGPSQLHVTGRILRWDPPRVFEHEWKVAPRPELPSGEDGVIRWELRRDGDGTILHLEHRNLNRQTALGFAPGTHAFLDRLDARLSGQSLPNWQERYTLVAPDYPPSWISGTPGRQS
ncbi:MAG: SRPBCC domain-containing protein [Thaumarchaeota archaeon]|nr:SRPBCC domain-containing protein [Nitrososphaerota archaeon]